MKQTRRGRQQGIIAGRYLVLLLVVAVGLVITARQAHVAGMSYHVSELKDELAHLEAQVERTRYDVARLKSMERIERIAVNELDMSRPEQVRLVFVPATEQSEVVIAGSRVDEDEQRGVRAVLADAMSRVVPTLGRAEAHTRR